MKNRNQNQKQYLVHWGDTYSDDFYPSLEEAKEDIEEAIEHGDECPQDIRVYEISATYEIATAGVKLIKVS